MSNQEKPTCASASDLFHRALSCADRGDMQQAEDLYQASIRQYEQLYDDQYETPPQILAALGNLALVYADTGRYDQEVRALEKALAYGREFARCDENFLPRVVELENDLAFRSPAKGCFPAPRSITGRPWKRMRKPSPSMAKRYPKGLCCVRRCCTTTWLFSTRKRSEISPVPKNITGRCCPTVGSSSASMAMLMGRI